DLSVARRARFLDPYLAWRRATPSLLRQGFQSADRGPEQAALLQSDDPDQAGAAAERRASRARRGLHPTAAEIPDGPRDRVSAAGIGLADRRLQPDRRVRRLSRRDRQDRRRLRPVSRFFGALALDADQGSQ